MAFILNSIVILSGFEVLTELQNLLTSNQYEPSVKESLIIDASNRFFTMIPSIHPHIIRDDEDFKLKVCVKTCTEFLRGCHFRPGYIIMESSLHHYGKQHGSESDLMSFVICLLLYIACGLVCEGLALFK